MFDRIFSSVISSTAFAYIFFRHFVSQSRLPLKSHLTSKFDSPIIVFESPFFHSMMKTQKRRMVFFFSRLNFWLLLLLHFNIKKQSSQLAETQKWLCKLCCFNKIPLIIMPKISTIFFEGNYSSVLGQLENEVEKPLSENQPEYKSLVWHYPFSSCNNKLSYTLDNFKITWYNNIISKLKIIKHS